MNFIGKTALITGAAGGIGAIVTSMLREAGAHVAVADLDVSGITADFYLQHKLEFGMQIKGNVKLSGFHLT